METHWKIIVGRPRHRWNNNIKMDSGGTVDPM
jgi:hypothetical protein